MIKEIETPTWSLDEGCHTITIAFPSNPPVALKLDVAEVEKLLKNLGDMRAAMESPVVLEYALGQKVAAVSDPIWRTEPDAMMGNSLLHIRDPRYGWLHYMIPKPEAKKLGNFLQVQAEDQALVVPNGKVN